MKSSLPLLVVHALLLLSFYLPVDAQVPGEDPQVRIALDSSSGYVNGTPSSRAVVTISGVVTLENPPVLRSRMVVVTLNASSEGATVTVSPETVTFTALDASPKPFTVVAQVDAPPGWEVIDVFMGGLWELQPGVRSGPVPSVYYEILPEPYSYIQVSSPPEVNLKPGEEGSIVLRAENIGNVEGGLLISLDNRQELLSQGVVVGEFQSRVHVGAKAEESVEIPITASDEGDYTLKLSFHTWEEGDNATHMVNPTGVMVPLKCRSEPERYSRVRVTLSLTRLSIREGESGEVDLSFKNEGNAEAHVVIRIENPGALSSSGIFAELSESSLDIPPGGRSQVTLTVRAENGTRGDYTVEISFENRGEDGATGEVIPPRATVQVSVSSGGVEESGGGGEGGGEGGWSGWSIIAIVLVLAAAAVLVFLYLLRRSPEPPS